MNRRSFLSGKRFLIAQPMIRGFCGSTMVTLELAEYLSSIGAKVIVYTNIAFPPALSSFEDAGIKVVSSHEKYDLSLNDYDYIWVHSLTLPQQMLEELKRPPKKVPAFIFLHMSPLESIPDEHPWIYELENSLSSLSLYISEGTLDSNKKYGLPPKVAFFRNPAPLVFTDLKERKISKKIKKLLIVSNHPPEEVLEARKILTDAGIRVDVYGEGQDNYTSLSPKILKKYDAVITIGKTVQYCIVGGFPVYIYDWFGGPGWLTEDNYEFTKSNNFSGRFSDKKTGKEIAREIIDGYAGALNFHLGFLMKESNQYIIDCALNEVLDKLKPRKIMPLDSEYIESAKAAVGCAEIRFTKSEELGNAYKHCDNLAHQIDDYKRQLDGYRQQVSQYEKQIQQLNEEKREFDSFHNSRRIRLLNKVLAPHDKIKGYLKKS